MALWTPANYGDGTQVLVDIDPALFTGLVDGDPISTGQDASGNARHMTAAGSARPTWQTAELDGKAVARFDGVDDVGAIADTGLTGQPFVVAMVARFNSPLAADASLLAGSGWSISYDFVTPDAGLVIDLGSPQTVGVALGGQPVTTPLVLVGGYDGTASLFRSESTAVLSAVELGTTGYPDAFNVGANAAGTGEFVAMDLARLIVAEYVDHASTDILLAYLAWEYGLEGTLPLYVGYPYLTAPPEAMETVQIVQLPVVPGTDFLAMDPPATDDVGKALYAGGFFSVGGATFAGVAAYARTDQDGVYEWHTIRDTFSVSLAISETMTNLASQDVGSLVAVDLTGYTEVELSLRVATAGTTGEVKLQYTTDGSTFSDMSSPVSLSGTGIQRTSVTSVPSGARGPVGVKAVAFNGNGSEDPVVRFVVVRFRR